MTELSYPWDGSLTGHATDAPYDNRRFMEWFARMIKYHVDYGIIPGHLNDLVVEQYTATRLRVLSGAALCDLYLYENDASVFFDVSTPGSGYYYYRVVVRAQLSMNTALLALLGPSATSFPSLTQDNFIYDIPVARVMTNATGIYSIVQSGRYLRNNGLGLVRFAGRQGGNATNWATVGTTDYSPDSDLLVQAGAQALVLGVGSNTVTPTFPQTFGGTPIVMALATGASGDYHSITAKVTAVSTTQTTIQVTSVTYSGNVKVYWIAIGPKA